MPVGRRVRPDEILETDGADRRGILDEKDCVNAPARGAGLRSAINVPLGVEAHMLVPHQSARALVDEFMQPLRAPVVDDDVGAGGEARTGFGRRGFIASA